ncbi:MAG TPA: Glu/Leu/Phe/Val dehydrogenase dimerization domain-containing protein [Streptosporangiaceae bacterium]|jgi:glutamate dehydrogenase/leucine dehydrogenase
MARQAGHAHDEPQAGESGAGWQPQTITLSSVHGFIVFDLPGAAVSAGGTRLAPDVTAGEVALLARAMTYKFASLGAQVGGAKAGVIGDPADLTARAGQLSRYCAEVAPLVAAGRFLTGPDMGTFEQDFAPLRASQPAPAALTAVIDDLPFEDILTGYGVTAAAEAALRLSHGGGWDGRSVAIEGLGKVGGGVAREVAARGGLVVALSTLAGCIADQAGLDVGRLLELRREHGDQCVTRYGLPAGPADQLFAASADVLVPGTRPGVITAAVAGSLAATVRVIAPAANVPYTRAGAEVLASRGIVALPDFICNAGAVIGYRSASDATSGQVLADAGARIDALISAALAHQAGPLAGACQQAAEFVRSWWGEPPPPPFAPEP